MTILHQYTVHRYTHPVCPFQYTPLVLGRSVSALGRSVAVSSIIDILCHGGRPSQEPGPLGPQPPYLLLHLLPHPPCDALPSASPTSSSTTSTPSRSSPTYLPLPNAPHSPALRPLQFAADSAASFSPRPTSWTQPWPLSAAAGSPWTPSRHLSPPSRALASCRRQGRQAVRSPRRVRRQSRVPAVRGRQNVLQGPLHGRRLRGVF